MDEKNQRERLEQELRFLKESFEAEVISKEEFEKGRERIELKLREIGPERQVIDENKSEEINDYKNPKIQPEKAKSDGEKKNPVKNESKFYKYALIFLVLVLVAFFSYSAYNKGAKTPKDFTPLCSSDADCNKEGMIGTCINADAKDARCEYKELQKINILIVNDKNCFICDASRIKSILKNWFGQIDVEEIDYSSDLGKELPDEYDAKLLPLYILDGNVTKTSIFNKSSQIFIEKNGNYVLSEDATGASFYFRRPEIQNRLDFFAKPGDAASSQSEKNLKEFLDAFKDVKFEKHSSDNLTKELGIKIYPAFLINNKIKFTGIQPPEAIKEKFCKANKLASCNISLSKNLV